MRGKGINYDTGFFDGTRKTFDRDVVRRETQIIADDLHCNSIRVSGDDVERLVVAGECALDAGLELWFAPFPTDLPADEVAPYLVECARAAERLRARSDRVVFVTGCEITLFSPGFVPGASLFDRIPQVLPEQPSAEHPTLLADAARKLNDFLTGLTREVRTEFSGPITYASGKWEDVDWSLFDIVSVDYYRSRLNAAGYRERLRSYRSHGKPVAVTEFGCCTFRGAGQEGGTGWMIVDHDADPPRVRGPYVRDEGEQVRYMDELLALYEEEKVDSAFWFTFAAYGQPHRADPLYDLDMGSYGVVKMLEHERGTTYPDMSWEPKEAFHALAAAYAHADAQATTG